MHPADVELACRASQQMQSLQLMGVGPGLDVQDSPRPDDLFDESVPFEFDGLTFDVIHTPGHSPGGVCLYRDETLIVGDTLFMGSIGRTDLPGGSTDQLIESLRPLPARKLGVLEAAIWMVSPVRGFRPVRALRSLASKVPNPVT
jgi:glyoxylase-like metal-dependent hydrolase (beta-lactamase superfamily II)